MPQKKSPRFHKQNIRTLKNYFGDLKLSEFNSNVVVKYVGERIKTVKSSTIRKEINTLNHCIKTALALWDYPLKVNPVILAKNVLSVTQSLKSSKPRARRLADGEENKLLMALSDAVLPKLITLLTLATARRLSEILNIESDDISIISGQAQLRVRDSKTGHAFNVPLSDNAKNLLPTVKGKLFSIQSNSVSQAFGRAVKRAGLINLNLTDLRHEALSRLFEQGFSVPEVMAISGHKSPEVLLKVYANINANLLSEKLNQAAKSN